MCVAVTECHYRRKVLIKSRIYCPKQLYISAKEPYIAAKEPYIYPRYLHKICVAVAECHYQRKVILKIDIYDIKVENSYICANEPYIAAKEPYTHPRYVTKCVWPSQSVTTNARYS